MLQVQKWLMSNHVRPMRNALKRIQDGEYAKMFITEGAMGYPSMTAYRRNNAAHAIEKPVLTYVRWCLDYC